MTGRSVFVTGAYGLLGRWLVEALLREGARVTVLRRDRVPQAALVLDGLEARCAVVTGDVTDAALLERALGEHEVDVVFHLAAQTIVGTARRSPVPTYEANVRGTWLLLEACRRVGVRAAVVAASDKAYGPADELPYTEAHALRPTAPYDVSKACADLIARSYFHTYGLPVATTRFANLYGGGDLNRSRLVPEAIAAALAGRAPVIRSDGTPERDFLAAQDAAAAYIAIARALLEPDGGGAGGEAFNAGGEQPHSVLEVVEAVCRAAGVDLRPDVRGKGVPDGEIDRQWVDSSKLRALTGWRPLIQLGEGLRQTVAWYRAHPGVLG